MKQPRRKALCPVAASVGAIWSICVAVCAFVIAVDPYDARSWGADTTLPGRFEPFHMDRLIFIAAKDRGADLVLVGTSPTTPYSPRDLQRAYSIARRPWNISVHGGLGQDRLIALSTFAEYSSVRHYIITVDFFLAAWRLRLRPDFPAYMYDADIVNDLRIFNARSVTDAYSVLVHGSLHPEAGAALRAESDFNRAVAAHWRSQEQRALMRHAARNFRAEVFSRGRSRCDTFPAATEFMEAVGRLRTRGARVDLLIPTYSSAFWFTWAADKARLRELGPSMLEDQLAMRRCVVSHATRLGAAVYAQDDNPEIINDLRLFRDPGHIQGDATLQAFIRMPEDARHRLTPDNFDDYAHRVRLAVLKFDPDAPW